MAEEFILVTPEEKALIDHEFVDDNGITRRVECVSEQKDGTFVIKKTEYDNIILRTDVKAEEIKLIDFSKKEIVMADELDPVDVKMDEPDVPTDPKDISEEEKAKAEDAPIK